MIKTRCDYFCDRLKWGAVSVLVAAVCITNLINTVPTAQAATDGTLGGTSQGSTDMSLSVPDLVRVTGIADLSFGNYSGSGSAVLNDNICIYNNNAGGQYKVTASGNGALFAFSVTDGNSHTIPYTVKFNAATGTSGNFALATTVTSSALSGANSTSQTCGGGNNANFEVTFTQNDLLSKPAGTYTGVLTLVIEPG